MFERMTASANPRGNQTHEYLISLLWAGGGSVIYGALNGWILCVLLKKFHDWLESPILVIYIIIAHAMAIYASAHFPIFQLSGDVALIIFAFQIRNLGIFNFPPETLKVCHVTIMFLKEVAEH
jgi:NhaP-type Na+/H+ or K+/H+ antiporter